MPHRILKVSEHGMLDAYEATLKARGFKSDPAQRAAAQRLQGLYTELVAFKAARRGTIRKLLARPKQPRSVYFWGGVGRGKSFLMDCFFDSVPYQRKRRVHFHAFMQEVQNDLKNLNHEPDPLQKVADRIARQTRLLCFDEFHVSDIADAMILGRLLKELFERGVVFVMTSNYPPDGLYPNGLQRLNFLPTIALMQQWLTVVNVDGGQDYRLRELTREPLYITPLAGADGKLEAIWQRLAHGASQPRTIEILGRPLRCRRHVPGAIWFDFRELCGGPRAQTDYVELACEYHTVFLSDIPRLGSHQASEARRLTWLVDVFYDSRVKLVISAEVEADLLYTEGVQASEFFRTASRLTEMQSSAYLALAHRLAEESEPAA
mgnify:CR=1 FL=1